MAIYHLHMQIIGRSKGKSAVASAAYRRAAKLFDEKENKSWNYENKPDVIHREIIAPDTAPLWIKNIIALHQASPNSAAEQLWNHVEKSEKRIDAQLAREAEFSLPIELNQEQCIKLTREFIHDQFALRGMIADWSVHWDEGNPHVHVMLTMRELTQEGFGKKVTAWNDRALLTEWRAQWAEYANFHLRLHQHAVKIDHRSYKEQGIDLVPTTHLGKAVTDMDKRGLQTDLMKEAKVIHKENLSRISVKPEILLDKITKQQDVFTHEQLAQELGRYIRDKDKFTSHPSGLLAERSLSNQVGLSESPHSQDVLTPKILTEIFNQLEHHESVFSERDIAKALSSYTDNAEQFTRAMMQVRSSSELLHLGAGEDGRDRFTTHKMFKLENEVQQLTDALRDRGHVSMSPRSVQMVLNHYQEKTGKQLTGEQLAAIDHITKVNSISCLIGRAGTGKSFSLGAARAIWEANGVRVIGVALSGIASDGLSKDAGIQARTIDSFRYAVQQGHLRLNARDVVVMDEAGMTDSTSMHAVLKAVYDARAKLVLVGDPDQLQPVGPGATFRALLERLGFNEIKTIYRQQQDWQRQATVAFAAGKIDEGLTRYNQQGCIHFEESPAQAVSCLINDWLKARDETAKDLSQYLVIAHRNEDVTMLNQTLRQHRIKRGEIKDGHSVPTLSGTLLISEGDRLLFLKNNKQLGVKNGRFGTVTGVVVGESGRVLSVQVKLDGDTQESIQINPESYADFTYGYAATVHKVQGMTVDHAFIYAGGAGWNRNLAYVAMTRHRHSCHLYATKEAHQTLQALSKCLSRFALKDSLLDYPLAFASRRGIDVTAATASLSNKLAKQLRQFKQRVADRVEEWADPVAYWNKKHKAMQDEIKIEQDQRRREDARHVAAYMDAKQTCGAAWKRVQEKMVRLGMDEIRFGTTELSLLTSTEEYQLLLQAYLKRDELAVPLNKEPSRYERALTRYAISMDQLEKQAEAYHRRDLLVRYQQAVQSGKTVLRDRLAMTCMADIKRYYRFIKEVGLTTQTIRQQALAHAKRQRMSTLSVVERTDFRKVESYQKTMQSMGKLIGELQSIKDKSSADFIKCTEKLTLLSMKRNEMAFEIYNDAERFNAGLDFFQIGIATSLFGLDKPSQELIQQAEARWYKLQDYAAKQGHLEHVKLYQSALTSGHIANRFQLSREITKEPRLYHPAVLETGTHWKQIRRDAKCAEAQAQFAMFSSEEKAFLRLAKKYQRTHRQVGRICSYVINAEKNDSRIPQEKRELSQLLIAKRDYLAARLVEKKSICELSALFDGKCESAGLLYSQKNFRIDFTKIEKQADKHNHKLQQLHTWQDLHYTAVESLSRLIKRDSIGHVPQFQLDDQYLHWSNHYDDVCKLTKTIQKQDSSYHYALASMGLSHFHEKIRYSQTLSQLLKSVIMQKNSSHSEFLDEQRLKNISRAKRIEHETKAIRGTLAERYLREHRGIQGSIPKSYRYHPGVYHPQVHRKLPALVVIAKNEKDQTRAVQVIYLDAKTANKAKVETPKLTFGVLSHGMMGALVNRGKNANVVAIAEGPETALSIHEAHPNLTVYAVLGSGNLSRAPISNEIKHILFCADNDGDQSASQRKLQKAADYFADKNKYVWQTMPDKVKHDFNDVLKANGKENVLQCIKNAELIRAPQSVEIAKLQATHFMAELIGERLLPTTTLSLNDLLLSYVNCEIEQTHFVTSMNEHRVNSPAASTEYALKAAINNKKREAIGLEVIKQADAQYGLEKKSNKRPLDIQKLGGFNTLLTRLQKGKVTADEIAALIAHIHHRVQHKNRSQNEHHDRTR